jgi:hypothetical protein
VTDKPLIYIHSRVMEFGLAEEQYYPDDGRSLFSLALSQVQRYEFFLRMILQRHEQTITEFMGAVLRQQNMARQHAGARELTDAETALVNRINNLSPHIQLDSESFYLFAKVLLDRIAKFIEDYFRPAQPERDFLRNYTFKGSHNTFTKQFEPFATRRKLLLPVTLVPLANELREKVSNFRDKHITHNHNMRVLHATAFSVDGSGLPRIMKVPTSSRDLESGAEQVESIAIHALMGLLDRYLDAVFALIVCNREYSAFMRFPASDSSAPPTPLASS